MKELNQLLKAGIRIYPVHNSLHRWAICVEDDHGFVFKNKKTVGQYKHTTKNEINKAHTKAIEEIYKRWVNQ